MPYIKSLLDNDLYSLTMQNAILEHYPNTPVTYKFTNRNLNMKFNGASYNAIVDNIKALANLSLTDSEYLFLKEYKFLGPTYLEYLRNYRFKPEQVTVKFLDGDLDITVSGPWEETIFFEVPLLAIISEAYFEFVDFNWATRPYCTKGGCGRQWQEMYDSLTFDKAQKLATMNDKFTDFGTRRRRSYDVQDLVVKTFKESGVSNFFGTSNVHLAHKYGLRAVGTMAHQWFMGVSALESLRYANKFALHKWQETYKGSLGYALTDTFGTDAFFRDFDQSLARVYDGVRHDSGCPFTFADRIIDHYNKLGIDPTTKLIVFSDGLDVDKALAISKHCAGRVRCSFGIGTFFSNDVPNSKPLNMVIKLYDVNGIPVVKLSDSPGKATGDKDAIRVALWTFKNQSLDAK
jgi:nicotinate phosphoribosyltransferase